LSGKRAAVPDSREFQPGIHDSSELAAWRMKSRVARNALIESLRMQKRPFFRWIFPAILGLLVGFLALAWAITSESNQPVSLVSFLSPGLKIAELVMPAAHESLAWTFGWFLRIAIAVNAIFYFSIFVLLAYLVDRRRSQNS
jgi:cellulose synthase/poly-beta-1,6-N-acetylglucosamine synthase-like glycosyltransferase